MKNGTTQPYVEEEKEAEFKRELKMNMAKGRVDFFTNRVGTTYVNLEEFAQIIYNKYDKKHIQAQNES